jgi:hypothetical protein
MSRISSGTLIVGTTAVQIDGNSVQPCVIKIRNNESTKTLFVGNSDVTYTNGLPIAKETTLEFKLPPSEAIHMVSDSGNHSVSWLRITE